MAIDEADILSQLNLGITKEKPIDNAVVIAIQSVTKQGVEIARELLMKKGTGSLAQSVIALPVQQKGNVFEFKVVADSYADFIDKGVDGTVNSYGSQYKFRHPRPGRKHMEAIRRWIPATGMKAKEGQTYEQLSWAVAAAVKQKGIKPYPFIKQSFGDEYTDNLAKALLLAIGKAVTISLTDIQQ